MGDDGGPQIVEDSLPVKVRRNQLHYSSDNRCDRFRLGCRLGLKIGEGRFEISSELVADHDARVTLFEKARIYSQDRED
jgi:hypothetical protein